MHRPLRAVAHRPAACRQCPHRAAELAVRAQARAASSCCASTTPTSTRSDQEFEDAIDRRPGLAGPDAMTSSPASPTACRRYQRRRREAEGGGPALSLLRDRSRTGAPARKRQLAARKPPVYDRAALALTRGTARELEAEGRKPHWRFKLSRKQSRAGTIWCAAPVEIDTATMSDPVLVREDGAFSTPAVGGRRYRLRHQPCHARRGSCHQHRARRSRSSRRWARRCRTSRISRCWSARAARRCPSALGSLSLRALREDGIEPMALASYLAKIGTSDPVEPRLSLDELAAEFDFAKIGRAPAHFDPAELTALNAKTAARHALRRGGAAPGRAGRRRRGVLGRGAAQSHAPGRCRRSGAPGRRAR